MDVPKIDDLILSNVKNYWKKIAMVVAKSANNLQMEQIEYTTELIAERINTLIENGVLESRGNVENWRRSEIRLSQ